MSTKHTPGPWQTDAGGEVHKDGRTIFAWPELSGAENEEIHANMTLGAAAPDLLAALKGLLAYVEDGYGDHDSAEGKEARDAITKAEGGE